MYRGISIMIRPLPEPATRPKSVLFADLDAYNMVRNTGIWTGMTALK
jgi:hypothetical protein